MAVGRSIQRYGWRRDLADHRDRVFNLARVVKQGHELPRAFSRRPAMPKVFDQGQLGSCTANAIVGALMAQGMVQGEAELMLSRLFVYYGERAIEGTISTDSGAQIRDGIKVVASEGAPPEADWPYDIAKFAERPPEQAYADAKRHEAIAYERVLAGGPGAPLRTAIAEHGPVVFGFSVPERFESADWDPASEPLILPSPGEAIIAGHAVMAVGYDFSRTRFPVDVFEVRNSWGPEWGDGGYFWMQAAWLAEPHLGLSSDFWLIERVS